MRVVLALAVLLPASLLVFVAPSCDNTAGTYCQQQSDCRTGLFCRKPPPADGGAPDSERFGICEPARRGSGETCLLSSECQDLLICSNEVGLFTGDERHGTCQQRPDAGTNDAAAQQDGGAQDGGAQDASLDAAPHDGGELDGG